MVKIADKIANLRSVANTPPGGWSLDRRRAYFDWARAVVERVRPTRTPLEQAFAAAYKARP